MKSDTKIFESEVCGDVHITQSSQYNNLKADTVVVAEGIMTRLFGTVLKKLIIGRNATVYFHGSLLGEVENNGGELHKY